MNFTLSGIANPPRNAGFGAKKTLLRGNVP
jgi:hypothetical protein